MCITFLVSYSVPSLCFFLFLLFILFPGSPVSAEGNKGSQATSKKEKNKKTQKKKNRRQEEDLEAGEDTDEGEMESREMDYTTDSSSNSEQDFQVNVSR